MDQLIIPLQQNNTILNFEVRDYPHHENDACKFEVYTDGELVVSFEPDKYGHLHICKNPGKVNNEVLYELAQEIEKYHW